MTEHDRRRDRRRPDSRKVGVFLSRGPDGPALSPVFDGQLLSLSRNGARIALAKIMFGAVHLAFGPMESDTLQLNLRIPRRDADESVTIAVRPIWLNKKKDADLPPFHIGVQFSAPLTDEQLQQLLPDVSPE